MTAEAAEARAPAPRAELQDAVRGFAGGMLFGIPLLYTMEVWWVGGHTTPTQMLLVLLTSFGVTFLLNVTGGFKGRGEAGMAAVLHGSVEAVAIGLASSAVLLTILQEIGPGVALRVTLGKVIYEAMPFAIGVSLARHFLRGDRVDPDEELSDGAQDSKVNATLVDLGAAAVGAVFVALNIAPTEEVPMLTAAMAPLWLMALVPVSLGVTYLIVFAADFGNREGRSKQQGILQRPWAETMAAYLVSLLMAGLLLFLFQQFDTGDSWTNVLSQTVVLGLPAAVGGAAGRLAV